MGRAGRVGAAGGDWLPRGRAVVIGCRGGAGPRLNGVPRARGSWR